MSLVTHSFELALCILLGAMSGLLVFFPRLIPRFYKAIIAVFFVSYSYYCLARFSPDGTFAGFFMARYPVIQDDYGFRFAGSLANLAFFKDTGRIWGYNPYFYAGFTDGIFQQIADHWIFLFILAFGGLLHNPALAFNLAVLCLFMALPVCAYFTASNFRLGRINSLFFFILSFYFVTGSKEARTFHRCGMPAWVFSVFFSLFVASLLYRYLQERRRSTLMALAFSGAFALFVHPLSAVNCAVFCTPILFFYRDKLGAFDWGMLGLCVAVAVAANLIWIVPLVSLSNTAIKMSYFQTHPAVFLYRLRDIDYLVLLLCFFAYFLYRSYRGGDRRRASVFLLSWVIFFTLTGFGSQAGLSSLEPARFFVPLILLSLLALSTLVEEALEKKDAVFAVFFVGLCVTLIALPERFVSPFKDEPAAQKIIDFIKGKTSPNARIHVQDSKEHPYFESHFTAVIPYYASRQILAGPTALPSVYGLWFTQFVDERLFNKELHDISAQELEKYSLLYNVKYYLVFSKRARAYFAGQPRFREVFREGIYSIHEFLDSDESFCYGCSAKVSADYNYIRVTAASQKETVLKYHYTPWLRTRPPGLKIRPVKLLDDPNPFIAVENGECADFVVYHP